MAFSVDQVIYVTDIPYITDDIDELKDKLEVYFGKQQNGGGEVEKIICPLAGKTSQAFVVFESAEVATAVLNHGKHTFEEDQINVILLPAIFPYVEVDLEKYYWDILSLEKATDVINTLENQLGQQNVSHNRGKVQTLRGSYQQLEAIRDSIPRHAGMGLSNEATATAEESEVTARSLELTNIPYITDDAEKLVEYLRDAIDQPGKTVVDDIISPIKGNKQRAIVVFQTKADRDQYIQQTTRPFKGDELQCIGLPRVFQKATILLDAFYRDIVPKPKILAIQKQLKETYGNKVDFKDNAITGPFEQLMDMLKTWMEAAGLPLTVTLTTASDDQLSEPVKADILHNETADVAEEEDKNDNSLSEVSSPELSSWVHISSEGINDVSHQLSDAAAESLRMTETPVKRDQSENNRKEILQSNEDLPDTTANVEKTCDNSQHGIKEDTNKKVQSISDDWEDLGANATCHQIANQNTDEEHAEMLRSEEQNRNACKVDTEASLETENTDENIHGELTEQEDGSIVAIALGRNQHSATSGDSGSRKVTDIEDSNITDEKRNDLEMSTTDTNQERRSDISTYHQKSSRSDNDSSNDKDNVNGRESGSNEAITLNKNQNENDILDTNQEQSQSDDRNIPQNSSSIDNDSVSAIDFANRFESAKHIYPDDLGVKDVDDKSQTPLVDCKQKKQHPRLAASFDAAPSSTSQEKTRKLVQSLDTKADEPGAEETNRQDSKHILTGSPSSTSHGTTRRPVKGQDTKADEPGAEESTRESNAATPRDSKHISRSENLGTPTALLDADSEISRGNFDKSKSLDETKSDQKVERETSTTTKGQDTKADEPGAKESTRESNAATPRDSKHISRSENLGTPTALLDADSEISRGNFDKSKSLDETKSDQKVERETSTTTKGQDTKADEPGAKESTRESNAATPRDSKHISESENLGTPTALLDADSEISMGNFDKSKSLDETKSDQKVERETSTTTKGQDTKADEPGAKESTRESNAATPRDLKHISRSENLGTPTALLDADSEISRGNFDQSKSLDEAKSDQKVERETSTTTSNISEIIPTEPSLKTNQTEGIPSKEKYKKLDKDQTSLEAKLATTYQERTGTLESTTAATIAKMKRDNSSEPAYRDLKQALGEKSATEVHETSTPNVPSKINVETERGPTNVFTSNNKDKLVDSKTTSATSSHDPNNVQPKTSASSCQDNESNIDNDVKVNSEMKKVPASATSGSKNPTTSGSKNPTSFSTSDHNVQAMEDSANSRKKTTSTSSEVTATVEMPYTASNEKPPNAQGKPTMKTTSNQEAHEPIIHDSLGSEETAKRSKANKRKLEDAANALPNVENVIDAKKLKERQDTDTIVGDMQTRQSSTCTQATSTGNEENTMSTTTEKPQGGDSGDSTRREGNEQSRRKDSKSSQKSVEHVEVTDSTSISESNSSCASSAKTQPPDVDDVSSEDFVTIDAIAYKCLSKTAAGKLKRIKTKLKIDIDIKTPDNKKPTEQIAVFRPLPNASIQDVINAKEEFITLYQDSFFKIRRTPLTCDGLSQEIATYAIQETERKVEKIVIHKVKKNKYVFCGEEAVVTEAIGIFRQKAGIQPKPRRLMKKTLSGSNNTGSEGFSHPATTDQLKGSGTLENVPSAYPSAFYTKERLDIKVLGDDITKQKVDIIVNAANGQLEHNGGVAQAIANAAGKQLQDECNNIMWNRREKPVQIGECILTKAYRLNSKFVIHTVGPRYQQTHDPNVFFRELVDTFANVLRYAESQAAHSIAIPLISSGTYGGPKEICANALATALLDFSILASRKHVQQIFIVNIDQKATAMLQSTFAGIFLTHDASDDRFTKTQKVPQQAIKKKMTFTTPEGIEVIVEKGDITKGNVEVIVNAANGRLAHGGGVAGAISRAAGRRLQDESDRIIGRRGRPLAVGEFAVTEGYNINCNKVIHAVGPVYSKCRTDKEFVDQLRGTFTMAIKHANLPIETKRVAFPLISSGIYGGPKQLCAQAFVESVKEFSRNERNLILKQIYMVNIDDKATSTVCHACEACFSKDSESRISQSQNPILPSKQDVPKGYCGTTNKGIAVHVLNANIVQQDVDIIVNPTTPTIRHGGGISAAISDAAGYKLQKHCNYLFNNERKTKPLSIGETVVTEGFNLPCKTIIHTLGPVFDTSKPLAFSSKLQQTFLNCMKLANNSNEAKTIAFPLIASSTGSKETCAKAFADALHEFDKSEAAIKLTNVIIVANDSDSVLAVEKTICAYFQSQPTSDEGTKMPYDAETRSPEYVFRTKENMEVRVRTDDIAKQSTDVVFNYTDEKMTNNGQIAARLLSAAGQGLQKECDKRMKERKSLNSGNYLSTEGFKLPCKQVLHLSVLSEADCGAALRQTFLPSLLCAKTTLQAKSIAVPVLATESVHPDESASIFASALKQFSSKCYSSSSQRPITIYVIGMSSTVTTTIKNIFLDHFRLDGKEAQTSTSRSSGFSGDLSLSGQQCSTPITTQPSRRVTDGLDIPSASSKHKQAKYSDVVKGTGIAPPDPKQSHVYNSSSRQNICELCEIQKEKLYTLDGCKHKACSVCIEEKISPNSACQECGALFGLLKEENCGGKMKYYTKDNLQHGSHFKDGFIVMDFSVPTGTQNTSHPHPGSTFKGMLMHAYLPNTKEGLEVLFLIRWAFLNCQLFKITTSASGGDDRLVLGDIPLKFKYHGGFEFGYPDSQYLPEVRRIVESKQAELARADAAAGKAGASGRASAADGTYA